MDIVGADPPLGQRSTMRHRQDEKVQKGEEGQLKDPLLIRRELPLPLRTMMTR